MTNIFFRHQSITALVYIVQLLLLFCCDYILDNNFMKAALQNNFAFLGEALYSEVAVVHLEYVCFICLVIKAEFGGAAAFVSDIAVMLVGGLVLD